MGIFELFSKRQKKHRGEMPDIYQYTDIPASFRIQVIQIIMDTIGDERNHNSYTNEVYKNINKILCKEYGVFYLKNNSSSYFTNIYDTLMTESDYERCLDIIELSFQYIDINVRQQHWNFHDTNQTSDEAIDELNSRFKEIGLGYQFESNELVRVDSQFVHSETVKPLLQLLGSDKKYSGTNNEFLSAHEHYRHKRYKECLNDCLKSFESIMKAIHDNNSWPYKKGANAKELINGCLSNKLVPEYLQNQFSSLRTLLESGIPTIRNKEGGHGQGSDISNVPEYFASYTLHLTATNLLFLAKCEEAKG